jgi:hypothetical protein
VCIAVGVDQTSSRTRKSRTGLIPSGATARSVTVTIGQGGEFQTITVRP